MVRDDVVIVCELFVADRADASLFPDLSVEQLAHLGRRPQFPISTWMMEIFDPLNAKANQSGFGEPFSPAARNGFVNWAHFIGAESHNISLC